VTARARRRTATAALAHRDGERNAHTPSMFLVIAILLALAWLTGFVVFHVSVAAIHLLLLLAVVGVVLHFVRTPTSAGR
jgi:hypothetical protein